MLRFAVALWVAAGLATQALGADAPKKDAGPWTHEFKLSAFTSSIVSINEDDSLDATIQGTSSAVSYLLKFEGNVKWKEFVHTFDENFLLKYGETSTEDAPWTDSADEIRYEGKYDYSFTPPHLSYVALGFNTVFTGPEPEEPVLDPVKAKLSAGYGQRHELITVYDNTIEWRMGARVQRTWGDAATADEADPMSGIELVFSYKGKMKDNVTAELKYDAFLEFEDVNHIQHLLTAACTVDLSKLLKLEISLRAHFEHQPEDATSATGYDQFSCTRNTQLGLTYKF